MALRTRARSGRLLAVVVAAAAFVAALGGGVAMAADTTQQLDPAAVQQLFNQLQTSPVIEETCSGCHGNIADTDNYSSEIIFTHANHIMLQCSSCHTRFPHRPEGTSRPKMQGCFDCHGLRHGPMGVLATGNCPDCHKTPRERMRPSFHTWDWRGKPHVQPSLDEGNTKCAMCHTLDQCNTCHLNEGISWEPKGEWAYDSSKGCLDCHGQPLLQKQGLAGAKSFQVSGLEESVHQDLTCQKCHQDYRYDDKPSGSPLWTINVSSACESCHANPNTGDAKKDERLSKPVADYKKSIHYEKLTGGKSDSATCGSCHGGHFIFSTQDELGKARMHRASYRVCARCKQHGTAYDTYDDYYHGRAYKQGAADAPACWDCHNAHDIQPKSKPASTVNSVNIAKTCGTEGCHSSTSQQFGASAAELIHQKAQAQEDNWLLRQIANVKARF
ncbi:MAG TPA: cytochrome c3 family protein [Coriobacteriia bacterium]|nr:cytochrome c3 family protein [Coriobacteriia bacterium]